MSRRNIGSLPLPPRHYRPNLAIPAEGKTSFETLAGAKHEDQIRARLLSAGPFKSPRRNERAKMLAGQLSDSSDNEELKSLASSVYMRDQRIRCCGAVWQLVVEGGSSRIAKFALIPRGWKMTRKQLRQADPGKLLNALKVQLYRCGAKRADGWMIAFIHGEHDPSTNKYQLHVHGLAADGMIAVIDSLRTKRNFKSPRKAKSNLRKACQRVWVTRSPLTDLPAPITYILQAFWPARASGSFDGVGTQREREKGRIPEPYHSEMLMWLHEWKLKDMALLVKLGVTKYGLSPKKT